tara:strand:+ start:935 stop:2554 length:1620 start_codon:yes stop_codon:yes gene_type:complete
MFEQIKSLYQKTLYVSRLTAVANKKARIIFSVILSNAAVAFDVVIIVIFSSLITSEIVYENLLIINFINYFLESRYLLPLLVLLRFIFLFYEKLNIETLSLSVGENLRYYLMEQAFKKGNLSTSDAYFYINQVSLHVASFYRAFAFFINSCLQIVGYSVFLLFSDRQIFSVFLFGAILLIFPTRYFLKKGKHYQHVSFIEGKNVNANIQRIIDNLFLIKILRSMNYEFKNFKSSLGKFTESQTQNVIYGSLNSILPTFATIFILSLLFSNSIFIATISIEFIGVLLRLFQSLSSLNNGLNLVVNSSVHVVELHKLDTESPVVNDSNFITNIELNNSVEFNNVSFKYFNSEEFIFENLSLNFPKNKHTIITGPNGSGKSTLLGLISGLFIPDSGKISINTDKLGYIGVTPLIIDGSIRENLLYGNNLNISDEEIYEIITKFSLYTDNEKITLDKKINNKTLSSGQMQKISFMRSLLNDSEILLLDEATSNLDTKTKKLIFDILEKENITIINSTHNKDDFNYDFELKIDIDEGKREINLT